MLSVSSDHIYRVYRGSRAIAEYRYDGSVTITAYNFHTEAPTALLVLKREPQRFDEVERLIRKHAKRVATPPPAQHRGSSGSVTDLRSLDHAR